MTNDGPATKPAAPPLELTSDQVYRACDPGSLSFATTTELEALTEIIGQQRAVESVDFGIGIRSKGYNIYALGPSGTGKESTITDVLAREAASLAVPDDWVYVNNFAQPHRPLAIELPPGRGAGLGKDMERLVEELRSNVPAVFEGDEYRSKVDSIDVSSRSATKRRSRAWATNPWPRASPCCARQPGFPSPR